MIPRSSKPIKRSAPIARKRANKRTYKTARCQVKRCGKKAEVKIITGVRVDAEDNVANREAITASWCRSHAKARADTLFSLFIRQRDGECRIRTESPCVGPLQCTHRLSRRFLATRYDPENAEAGCAGHHAYWTRNPDRWAAYLDAKLGTAGVATLRDKAFNGEPADLSAVLSTLAGVKVRE